MSELSDKIEALYQDWLHGEARPLMLAKALREAWPEIRESLRDYERLIEWRREWERQDGCRHENWLGSTSQPFFRCAACGLVASTVQVAVP